MSVISFVNEYKKNDEKADDQLTFFLAAVVVAAAVLVALLVLVAVARLVVVGAPVLGALGPRWRDDSNKVCGRLGRGWLLDAGKIGD